MTLLLITASLFSSHIPQVTSYAQLPPHRSKSSVGLKQETCDGSPSCEIKVYGEYRLYSDTTIEIGEQLKIKFLPSESDVLLFDGTRESGVYKVVLQKCHVNDQK